MKIVQLSTENFKRLKAVEITPDGNVVVIRGKNGQGKTSCLDAIWVGLVGKSVAPPKPIRMGEEEAYIRLDLGDLIVTRRFVDKDGKITDTVKIESADGKTKYNRPQEVLDDLLGAIGFDPFAFVQKKPQEQADILREMVPLSIDLDEYAQADEADFEARRDINRDGAQVKAQLAAIELPAIKPDPVDGEALVDALGRAADHNADIQREELRRTNAAQDAENKRFKAMGMRKEADELRARAIQIATDAEFLDKEAQTIDAALDDLTPVPDPIDTDEIRVQLREAEQVKALLQRFAEKERLAEQFEVLKKKSEALTSAMAKRSEERSKALAEAQMPIAGLGIDGSGKNQRVTFNGVPFEQASTAEQLRVSTAIAMAANPELRVLRIKDGSLLDEDSMKMLTEMADAEDYQLWVEMVGTGGVGIVIENGEIANTSKEPVKKSAASKAKDAKPEGGLL